MGLPEKTRRAAWIAGAWEHGLKELVKRRREWKEYEEILACDTVLDEAIRRDNLVHEFIEERYAPPVPGLLVRYLRDRDHDCDCDHVSPVHTRILAIHGLDYFFAVFFQGSTPIDKGARLFEARGEEGLGRRRTRRSRHSE
jgi:hypothetical protein